MKYIVMECHEGYAVLMDEDARFVNAANLHYNVGQSVTDPIIMNNEEENSHSIKMYITRIAAAAACIGVIAAAGSMYYYRNLKPYSTILISSNANIKMEINQKGKVIKIKSDDDFGKEIIKNYNGKGKDKLTAANEILELEKEKGMISSGDTVKVYVDSENSDGYNTFKNDLESVNPDIKVKVSGLDKPTPPSKDKVTITKPDPPKDAKVPEPPKPDKDKVNAPEPPAPSAVTPPAPAEPPKIEQPKNDLPKVDAQKADTPDSDKKPDPPAPPSDPEPPKAPEKPNENAAPEPKKPDAAVEHPKAPAQNEAEPPAPDPKKPLSIVEDALIDIQKNQPVLLESTRPTALHPAPESEHDEPAQPEEVHPQAETPEPHHIPAP